MRVFSTLDCVLLPILVVAVLFGGSSSLQVLAVDVDPIAVRGLLHYGEILDGLMSASERFFEKNPRHDAAADVEVQVAAFGPFFNEASNFAKDISTASPAATAFSVHKDALKAALKDANKWLAGRSSVEAAKVEVRRMNALLSNEVDRTLRLKKLLNLGPVLDPNRRMWLKALHEQHLALTRRMYSEVESGVSLVDELPQVRARKVLSIQQTDPNIKRNLFRARTFLVEDARRAGAGSLPSSSAPA